MPLPTVYKAHTPLQSRLAPPVRLSDEEKVYCIWHSFCAEICRLSPLDISDMRSGTLFPVFILHKMLDVLSLLTKYYNIPTYSTYGV